MKINRLTEACSMSHLETDSHCMLYFTVSSLEKTIQLTVEGRRGKTGELNLVLDGLNIQMSKFPKKTRSPSSSSNGLYITYIYKRTVHTYNIFKAVNLLISNVNKSETHLGVVKAYKK